MILGEAFTKAFKKRTGKSPQQYLIDLIAELPPRELNDKSLVKIFVAFLATEWIACGRHDELSDYVRTDIADLLESPPDKLRDVLIIVRNVCDALDCLTEGDGFGEGRIVKRFYALNNALERRRKLEKEEHHAEDEYHEEF